MNLEDLTIIRLTDDYVFQKFDCGVADLNDFLLTDSKDHLQQFMSVTYLICLQGDIAAYFSVSNDKISSEDLDSKSQWKKLQGRLPHAKRWMKSFPAVKIGRLAVGLDYRSLNLGRQLMDYIKLLFFFTNKTGCRFILVDSLSESVAFYEKLGFSFLSMKDAQDKTRLMYFDLKSLAHPDM
jgi:predicted GNAT family N-acyltransferase